MTPSPRLQSPRTRVIQSERSPGYPLGRLLPLHPFAAGRIMDTCPVVFQREHPRLRFQISGVVIVGIYFLRSYFQKMILAFIDKEHGITWERRNPRSEI